MFYCAQVAENSLKFTKFSLRMKKQKKDSGLQWNGCAPNIQPAISMFASQQARFASLKSIPFIYAWFWLSYYSYLINVISLFSVFVKIHKQAVVLESSDNCHGSIPLPQPLLPRHGLRQTCRCQLQPSTKTSPVTISCAFSQHSKIKSYPFVF